jgi:hypothetical protein
LRRIDVRQKPDSRQGRFRRGHDPFTERLQAAIERLKPVTLAATGRAFFAMALHPTG